MWVDHLRAAGFSVQIEDVDDLNIVAERLVPAADIRQLLIDRPDAVGIVLPGIPIGAPGMEQGPTPEPYAMILFDSRGRTKFYGCDACYFHFPDDMIKVRIGVALRRLHI